MSSLYTANSAGGGAHSSDTALDTALDVAGGGRGTGSSGGADTDVTSSWLLDTALDYVAGGGRGSSGVDNDVTSWLLMQGDLFGDAGGTGGGGGGSGVAPAPDEVGFQLELHGPPHPATTVASSVAAAALPSASFRAATMGTFSSAMPPPPAWEESRGSGGGDDGGRKRGRDAEAAWGSPAAPSPLTHPAYRPSAPPAASSALQLFDRPPPPSASVLEAQLERLQAESAALKAENAALKAQIRAMSSASARDTTHQEEERLSQVRRIQAMVAEHAPDDDLKRVILQYKDLHGDFGKDRWIALRHHLRCLKSLLLPNQVTKMCMYAIGQEDGGTSTPTSAAGAARKQQQSQQQQPHQQQYQHPHQRGGSGDGGAAAAASAAAAAAADGCGVSTTDSVWAQLCRACEMTPEQQRGILSLRETVRVQRKEFACLLASLRDLEDRMTANFQGLELQMNVLMGFLSPRQIALFLTWMETSRPLFSLLSSMASWPAQQGGQGGGGGGQQGGGQRGGHGGGGSGGGVSVGDVGVR